MGIETIKMDLDGTDLRIGIVQARYDESICNGLRKACLEQLERLGVADEDILVCSVPGALEIPIALAKLAATQQFDALIAVGAVIKGETYHFELVSNEAAAGVSRVAIDFGIPIANAILTTYTDEQAEARMVEKGNEAASAAVEMANLVFYNIDEVLDAEDKEQLLEDNIIKKE